MVLFMHQMQPDETMHRVSDKAALGTRARLWNRTRATIATALVV